MLLAVAALTAVGFFADRLQNGLARDARALIGGDAVLSSDNLPPPTFEAQAKSLGLQTAQTLGFPTMGRAPDELGGAARLVALKSVGEGYPLRGSVRVAAAPEGADVATREIPAPGTAWVDAALLVALDLKMGQPVLLGDAAHLAHWSIGAGTKLALEDAIALHRSVPRHKRSIKAQQVGIEP